MNADNETVSVIIRQHSEVPCAAHRNRDPEGSVGSLSVHATADDVRECYRRFLKREPENDAVVRAHLVGNPRYIDMVAGFINSAEYKRGHERNYLSISKCLQGKYLAEQLGTREKVLIFTYHHKFLAESLPPGKLEEVLLRGAVFAVLAKYDVVMRIFAPQSLNNEGELLLSLENSSGVIFQIGFCFAPAGVFGAPGERVLFLARLQGNRGAQAQFRAFSQITGGLAPDVFCFEFARGVASAVNASALIGVAAQNHICFETDKPEVFFRNYDQFFEAHGFRPLGEHYFQLTLPAARKMNAHLSLAHRKRAEKRRVWRDDIARTAALAWRRLSQPDSASDNSGPSAARQFAILR